MDKYVFIKETSSFLRLVRVSLYNFADTTLPFYQSPCHLTNHILIPFYIKTHDKTLYGSIHQADSRRK